MSWRDAPLYVEAHDLSRWVLERASVWPPPALLAPRVAAATTELLTAISLALTFPQGRASYLHQADEEIVRLRMLLRLARDLGMISPGGLRFASGRLRTIGRMVGGWLRRLEQSGRLSEADAHEGDAMTM